MVVLSKINGLNNTSMVSYNMFFFFFILASILSFAATEAQDASNYRDTFCLTNSTTTNSAFQSDLRILLPSLSSNATKDTQFYNTTVTGRDPSDSVYGLFMCRGDVPSQLCQQCVVNASQQLSSECSVSKEAVIYYDECMVRYSNGSFFSTMDTDPGFTMCNKANNSDQQSFMLLLFSTINQIADKAALPPIGDKMFATKAVTLSGFQNLYCLAQCTPDLSTHDCRTCLSEAMGDLKYWCDGKQGGRVLYPSCNIRYELYPFYRITAPSPTPSPGLVPATNASRADSKFSADPFYLSHNCTNNQTFTADSTFQIYTKNLLTYLSSNATNGKKFYTAGVGDLVHGLFMCRGDVPTPLCGPCVQNATHRIYSECGSSQEAIIWYSHCMLRYSYRNFFSKVDRSPVFHDLNTTDSPIPEQNFFTVILSTELAQLAIATGDSVERYVAKSSKLNDLQTLYTLGQCTRDLSSDGCTGCLQSVIGTAIPWSRLGSVGGRVLYPSCNLRFELFPFYRGDNDAQPPTWPGNPSPAGEVPTQVVIHARTLRIQFWTIPILSKKFISFLTLSTNITS